MLTLYEISAIGYAILCCKVYLLLDDIVVVVAEGDERCLGVRECIELHSAFQNHTTVISTEIHE